MDIIKVHEYADVDKRQTTKKTKDGSKCSVQLRSNNQSQIMASIVDLTPLESPEGERAPPSLLWSFWTMSWFDAQST